MANDLSHAELWDDSTLVTSWNDALAEYHKYHSIAAKGEKVDIVLVEAQEIGVNGVEMTADDTATNVNGESASSSAKKANKTASSSKKPQPAFSSNAAPAASIPSALLSSVQDEGLKALMMSWYYAGYYTGVYEGKQQAFASMHEASMQEEAPPSSAIPE